MSALDDLRTDLDAARADLLAALDGVSPDDFLRPPAAAASPGDERWSIRDVAWHVGIYDDFVRRWMDATRRGAALPVLERRTRPVHMQTPDLLRAWLDQSRHATLVLLGKLAGGPGTEGAADLDVARPTADGGRRSFREALAFLAKHDREHAAQVRALRAEHGAAAGPGTEAAP